MRKVTALLVAVTLVIGVTTTANALSLRLSDGNQTITLNDNEWFKDMNYVNGAVTYIGSIGDFTVNVTTGISNPVTGSTNSPYMDLNSINVSNTSNPTAQLRIYLTDTNFTGTVPGFQAFIGGTTSGTATIQYNTYYDAGNTAFAETTLLTSSIFSGSAFSGGATSTAVLPTSELYSLTQEIFINGRGATSFDATIAPVPEPGTMVLLGAGLLGLAIFGKRRMNKDA